MRLYWMNEMSSPETNWPVFYDPEGRRVRKVRRVWIFLAAVFSLMAALFVASVLINPLLPKLDLRPVAALPSAADVKPPAPPEITSPRGQQARRSEAALQRTLAKTKVIAAKRPALMPITPPKSGVTAAANNTQAAPLAIGFYVNWDDSSYQSLKLHLNQLDWVVPEWIRLQTGSNPVVSEIDPRALDYIRRTRSSVPILPMIHNSKDGKWDVPALIEAIATEDSRRRVINTLSQIVENNQFQGICIDFEEVPAASQANLLKFMQELHLAFKSRNWLVTQAIPYADSEWNYRAYSEANDYLMLMAYDEHWSDSNPGSIASQKWFEETYAERMNEMPASKTIVCIGGYGYDWKKGGETTEMTFQEAVLEARDSEAKVQFDESSKNPYFKYQEEDGSEHTVWFLDAVTAFNQTRVLTSSPHKPAGFALWRLGSEDPSLWAIFGHHQFDAKPSDMHDIRYPYDVDFEGMGEILQVIAEPQAGARDIEISPHTQIVTKEQYTAIPSSYVIRRVGYRPGLIALTFDDGPDPVWTPKILDILKQEKVPAAFFIIGQNGETEPNLVKRIVAEGHDIGNHTFTHPNLGEIPGRLTELELTSTQRLIESLTGRSTRLFRPPYFGDAEPTTPDEVDPAVRAQHLGYLTVGLRVDPDDWATPGADEIIKRTMAGITNPDADQRGQVVLLHDAGGDRSQTVEMLPKLIHELRNRGYRFVTISELAGLPQSQTMPVVPSERGLLAQTDKIVFYGMAYFSWGIHWLFLIGIVLGLARLFFIGILAFAQRRRSHYRELTHAGESYQPFVSIIVPAYKEEKVIAQTIKSLLASDYPNFEIIVVDDGSPDRTSEVVREQFADHSRVRLFTKTNGGKAAALNYGLQRAAGEVIVALDADTIFQPNTLGALAHRFADQRYGAIAGNAKVGNRINIITRWQALEYITAQNLDRRAFSSLDCITVVPGAVGAWRRDLLEQVGGFASDTLAEDQDLTLKIRRMGYKIGYEDQAIAWTEAPDTVRALAKQRFRWSFGTLQCMWKHADALFRPRYGALGFIALPNVWIFQIIFPLISPIMDLMLIWSFISSVIERLQHPAEYSLTNIKQVMFYYALFLAVDWLAAAFAFLLERKESWSLLWWLFLQRFCYRQVMYYVMVKSVYAALKGAVVGWGKLERKATVEAHT